MRIAQLPPLYESVPPKLYGGTERVVAYLTEALVELGHEVTLFATADSSTSARLVPVYPRSLRLDTTCQDPLAPHVHQLELLLGEADQFDVIHSHISYMPFPAFRRLRTPTVTTQHGRLDLPELSPVFREFREMPLVSISDIQRAPFPWANWQATVYHGLPKDLLHFCASPEPYLAFLGRLSTEKRVDRAVEIARRTGLKLKVAAKVDPNDQEYFRSVAEPLMKYPWVEYVGEIGENDKNEFMGNALALLFPIDWPEPFGMVVIEAMACGTPIIAYRRGSVPEIVAPGLTGFIVDTIDEAVQAVTQAPALDRAAIRAHFERHFTAERMAREYLAVYQQVMDEATIPAPRVAGQAGVESII